MSDLLDQLNSLLGVEHVVTGKNAQPYLTDWRRRCTGKALAVVRPGTTEHVAEIVRLCAERRVPLVPQGGNTGQVAGATPDTSGTAIVVSLQRLNRIRAIDTETNTITVEAGCILQTIQDAAKSVGRLFPLSLGAEGSCLIGGNLATNAGGTQVLQYGNVRALTLGLEVVTAEGVIWDGLRSLAKDNTGYQLRDLFIGSEGTLGIITAATLKLFPLPRAQHTALVALDSLDDAIRLLELSRAQAGSSLTAFEIMSAPCLDLVVGAFPQQRMPFSTTPGRVEWHALLELSSTQSRNQISDQLTPLLERAMESGYLHDAAVASSQAQRDALWHLRESITLALAERGYCIKHDISLPVSRIASFVETTDAAIRQRYPGFEMMVFGHLGDGNLHYNVLAPRGLSRQSSAHIESEIQSLVHTRVVTAGGSISAEQGIGSQRVSDLQRFKTPVELDLMRRIKVALDPSGIMNPGKILDINRTFAASD